MRSDLVFFVGRLGISAHSCVVERWPPCGCWRCATLLPHFRIPLCHRISLLHTLQFSGSFKEGSCFQAVWLSVADFVRPTPHVT